MGSTNSVGFILRATKMSVQYIMAIYPVIVELFRAGPKVGD